jgi:tetratricopeptide (TPR) repeat protein
MEDQLATAIKLHQAGRFVEAESIYRRILFHNSRQADVVHLLGVLTSQMGKADAAIPLIERAIALQPKNVEAHSNLARIYAQQGRMEDAISSYARVTELRPADAAAWSALGVALRTVGRNDSALAAVEKSIRLNPKIADTHTEAGKLHRAAGRIDQAIESHHRATALDPAHADARNSLGNALLDKGWFDQAIGEFMEAVRVDPSRSVFLSNLGSALLRVDRNHDALLAFENAFQLDPDSVDALTGHGLALSRLREYDRASQSLNRALALDTGRIATLLALGAMHSDRYQTQIAEDFYQRVLMLDPRSVDALLGVGTARGADGKFDEAAEYYRQALAIDPDNAMAIHGLSTAGLVADSEVPRLQFLLNRPNSLEKDRIAVGFALGKLLDEAGRFDEAFECYRQANSTVWNMRAREGNQFDPESIRLVVDRLIEFFTPGYFTGTRDWGDPSNAPVFVVGMPRSGTTLVEQIAASHPLVFGAGELADIGNIAKRLLAEHQGNHWTRESIHREAAKHHRRLNALAPHAARIVDKMPANILNLGLIADLFPNARVILCQRDPRDTCLSCYFQWFSHNSVPFSCDLTDCAMQFRQQQRLAEHWLKNPPVRILPMVYEELVNDLENQSRRLINFLELEWDPKCLEFYKTRRTVSTASMWQVRQPIYTKSVGRWRHYERHLGPLLRALHL